MQLNKDFDPILKYLPTYTELTQPSYDYLRLPWAKFDP